MELHGRAALQWSICVDSLCRYFPLLHSYALLPCISFFVILFVFPIQMGKMNLKLLIC
jgi:hypothetical protein